MPPYRSFYQKMDDAVAYQQEERIPWPVLVDDLAGSVHHQYGGLADPTYLIGVDGRIAYYNLWTYAPALHEAILALLSRGGSGVVKGGWDRAVRLGPAMTDGWRGIQRGLPQSYVDMLTAAPGSGAALWLGYQLRPLLAPLTLRAEPLPSSVKIGLLVGIGTAALAGLEIAQQRKRDRQRAGGSRPPAPRFRTERPLPERVPSY